MALAQKKQYTIDDIYALPDGVSMPTIKCEHKERCEFIKSFIEGQMNIHEN